MSERVKSQEDLREIRQFIANLRSISTERFYASRRTHPDEPETWERPWTVRDRRTGAWYGTYPTKTLADADAQAKNQEHPS